MVLITDFSHTVLFPPEILFVRNAMRKSTQKRTMQLEVRESQIEDALVSVNSLTKDLLQLKDVPKLLVRQLPLPSGRLDLLYTYQDRLLLIELKVVNFQKKFLRQVLNYKSDLEKFQQGKKLVKGDIEPYLLCADASKSDENLARKDGVHLAKYDPQYVLNTFYENFKPIVFFTENKPIDIGIWNIHLINDVIYHLKGAKSLKVLSKLAGQSTKTLYNKIRFASELKLVETTAKSGNVILTELGEKYLQRKGEELPSRISESQAELLRDFVMKNPYESSVILGIASIVESVFILSKNYYPVPMNDLIKYFPQFSGKVFDWKTPKAKFHGARMYSNYAVDLGLLAKTQNSLSLTPAGVHFTIQMQMHKNLKMIEALPL
ncbi:MAG: hypothetical protein ACR2NQ_02180 [Thermodesulfobacteriota bacterium]